MSALERLAAWQREHPNYLVELSGIVYAPSAGAGEFYHVSLSILGEHILTRTSRASLEEAINLTLDEYDRRHTEAQRYIA
jgi:hypothetical protein